MSIEIPEDMALMPRELTAENGAKYLFSGEFKEKITSPCDTCAGTGYFADGCEPCDECDGAGEYTLLVTIGWGTIKDIYRLAVEKLEQKNA